MHLICGWTEFSIRSFRTNLAPLVYSGAPTLLCPSQKMAFPRGTCPLYGVNTHKKQLDQNVHLLPKGCCHGKDNDLHRQLCNNLHPGEEAQLGPTCHVWWGHNRDVVSNLGLGMTVPKGNTAWSIWRNYT